MDLSDPIEHLKELEEPTQRAMRLLVLHLLYAADAIDYQEPIETIIDNFNQGFGLSIDLSGQAATIARAIIAEKDALDHMIDPFLENWRQSRISIMVRLIIRLAVWELNQRQEDPRVIINEAIELTKQFSESDAYRLVNGVLDRMVKSQGR
jgi:transcription antitermination factor NusB